MITGDIVCAKSITDRRVVEVTEDKRGKQKVRANQYGYKFQPELNLISQVGVFLFLGVYPEADSDAVMKFAERQLEELGWKKNEQD